jgi:hypothetical protein
VTVGMDAALLSDAARREVRVACGELAESGPGQGY